MSEIFTLGDRQLHPLRVAAKTVGYSHDYVARLARESKISALQVNRQWYIDLESLKSFSVQAQLELQARREYTRELRRVEREISESLQINNEHSVAERSTVGNSAVKSFVVIILGCLVGMLVFSASPLITSNQLAAVFLPLTEKSAEQISPVWEVGEVVITETPVSLDQGLVLFSKEDATTTEKYVENMFSDPVMVTEISSTTGTISFPHATGSDVMYVRIPDRVPILSPSTGPTP